MYQREFLQTPVNVPRTERQGTMLMKDQPVSFRELVEFATGELNDEQRGRIEQALAGSTALLRDLEQIRRVLEAIRTDDTVHPPDELVERVASLAARHRSDEQADSMPVWQDRAACLIAQLVFDSRSQPALAGFRGASESYHLAYHSESAIVDLQVTPATDDSEGGSFRVRGQVTPGTSDRARGVRLLAHGSDQVVTETTADERGWFRFVTNGGLYDLKVALTQDTILLPDLPIG